MSFSQTVPQMRDRSKTVTRRHPNSWRSLEPGDQLIAVEKAMGLKKGEKQVVIGVIEVVSNTIVEVGDMLDNQEEARREGFVRPGEFFDVWEQMHGAWRADDVVRRIEFVHVP